MPGGQQFDAPPQKLPAGHRKQGLAACRRVLTSAGQIGACRRRGRAAAGS
jgi:hypothetical protein